MIADVPPVWFDITFTFKAEVPVVRGRGTILRQYTTEDWNYRLPAGYGFTSWLLYTKVRAKLPLTFYITINSIVNIWITVINRQRQYFIIGYSVHWNYYNNKFADQFQPLAVHTSFSRTGTRR